MNKTININLANVFFHIDENAFMQLDKYLKTIEQYLSKEQSKEEILQDIEARIAELFKESMAHENQVITLSQVNAMIEVMGEPEVYKIDDEEDSTSSSKPMSAKKLYRDVDRNYIGGVSAGLNYYLGLNLLLIRFIWIVSALSSFGATVIIYGILWAIIPPARTTAQKLDMQGEPVNLSNIEKKVKESYSKFADKVGDIDYDRYSQQTKSGLNTFFDGLGKVLKAIGVFISKFLGVILLIISSLILVGLLIFLFSFGTITVFELGDFNQMELFSLGIPYWIQVILFFLTAAIPFFYLLILSLKLIISNLKPLGKVSHITLVGLWIFSVIVITIFAVKNQLVTQVDAEVVEVFSLQRPAGDTLKVSIVPNLLYSDELRQSRKTKIVRDELDNQHLYSSNVFVNFKTTSVEDLKLKLNKKSFASQPSLARERAKKIDYEFEMDSSTLKLNSFLLTEPELIGEDVKVEVTVYIPKNYVLYLDDNLINFSSRRNFNREEYNHFLGYKDNKWQCLDCATTQDTLSTQN